MKTYWGLDSLKDVDCPKCGDRLEVMANGWFHGELLYCPKENRIFNIILKDITKSSSKEYLDQCQLDVRLKGIRRKINKDNIDKVEAVISQKKL